METLTAKLSKAKINKAIIIKIVNLWNALNTLSQVGIMPNEDDVEMDVQENDNYIDRWFSINLANGRKMYPYAEFCITNEVGEKPHIINSISIWYDEDKDAIETSVSSLKKILSKTN